MNVSAEIGTFQQPAIRHLAWLCRAPQLYRGALTFDPSAWLASDFHQKLRDWDQNPDTMPLLLQQPAPRRLGLYFEQLYASLLTDLLGWPLLGERVGPWRWAAAAIAFAGALRLAAGGASDLAIQVRPRWPLSELAPPA